MQRDLAFPVLLPILPAGLVAGGRVQGGSAAPLVRVSAGGFFLLPLFFLLLLPSFPLAHQGHLHRACPDSPGPWAPPFPQVTASSLDHIFTDLPAILIVHVLDLTLPSNPQASRNHSVVFSPCRPCNAFYVMDSRILEKGHFHWTPTVCLAPQSSCWGCERRMRCDPPTLEFTVCLGRQALNIS